MVKGQKLTVRISGAPGLENTRLLCIAFYSAFIVRGHSYGIALDTLGRRTGDALKFFVYSMVVRMWELYPNVVAVFACRPRGATMHFVIFALVCCRCLGAVAEVAVAQQPAALQSRCILSHKGPMRVG